MTKYNYSFRIEENMAKAVGRDLSISTKFSVEICNHLRGRPLERAMIILEDVMEKKYAIPFKRFNWNLGHKTKIGPGKYPYNASKEILNVLENVESNAQFKGLIPAKLKIVHLSAQKAFNPGNRGRTTGNDTKRTHIEVVVKEFGKTKPKKSAKSTSPTKTTKTQSEKPKELLKEKQND